MIKGLLFDLDGTIIDDEKSTIYSKMTVGQRFGYQISEDDAKKTLGLSAKNSDLLMRRLFGADVPVALFRQARRNYILADMQKNGITLKRGVSELLDYLDAHNYKKCLCTSTDSIAIEEYKKYGDIFDRFDAIVTGDQVENGKPSPDIFLLGSHILELDRSECLVIEDACSGIEAALSGNFDVVMIPDLAPIKPEYIGKIKILNSLLDIIDYLKEIDR